MLTSEGLKTITQKYFMPTRWIRSVHEDHRVMAIECLALILFAIRRDFNSKSERQIVERWGQALRLAAEQGLVTARDPIDLLSLPKVPDGWDWMMSLADADKFVNSNGMEWSCSRVAEWIFNECLGDGNPFEPPRRQPDSESEPEASASLALCEVDTEAPQPAHAGPPKASSTPVAALKTGEVAFVFGGIRFEHEKWITNLQDTPKWLQPFKVAHGGRGSGMPSTWNALGIAKAIASKAKGQDQQEMLRKLNSAFKQREELAPYREDWANYLSLLLGQD